MKPRFLAQTRQIRCRAIRRNLGLFPNRVEPFRRTADDSPGSLLIFLFIAGEDVEDLGRDARQGVAFPAEYIAAAAR